MFFASQTAAFLVSCLPMPTEPTWRSDGLPAVAEALERPGKILVTGHLRPDGDALGSAIALTRFLNRSGHTAFFTALKTQLGRPGFLVGDDTLVVSHENAIKKQCNTWVVLDCGDLGRLPEPLRPYAADVHVINIDHHATNTRYGEVNWVEPSASCTGELVWRLAREMDWPLDRATAEALWVSLVTDTGRFAHDHVRPSSMQFAADLLDHGVRTSYIDDRLYGSLSANVMELKRRAFASFDSWFDGQAAYIALTRRDFHESRANRSDAEDFTDIPRSLDTARVALFFHEDENATRCSIRTRAPLDATLLAGHFGGGGHPRAAGCSLDAPLYDAMRAVKEAIYECYDEDEIKI